MSSLVQATFDGSATQVIGSRDLLRSPAATQRESEAPGSSAQGATPNDDLLLYLQETEDMDAEMLLERLISQHAGPIVRDIIRSKLRVSMSPGDGSQLNQDALDVGNDVQALLLAQLRSIKAQSAVSSIANFPRYVAAITYNACYKYLRRKYPRRSRLKNRLRYLLTHHNDFALWESPSGDWLCGLATMRLQDKDVASARRLHQLRDIPEMVEKSGVAAAIAAGGPAPGSGGLAAVFRLAGGPVELDLLVTTIATLYRIRDENNLSGDTEEDSNYLSALADPCDVSAETEQRHYLRQLWSEICQLPLRQRLALLLNLKDAQGRGVIALLPLTGIAGMRQIAGVLDMSAECFACLWNDLPLEDSIIGKHMGATRQQVVNLRKCARERLARRMKNF